MSEALHVRSAVFAAPLRTEPSEHVYVERFFSPPTYEAILRNFPDDPDAFQRWKNPGDPSIRFANYGLREEIMLPDEADRLTPEQRAFWTALAELLCGPEFARTLLDRFAPYARARFGAELDDPSFVESRLNGTMILNRHEPGYYLGPHTDRNEKVFTCVFYFPERDGLDHLGTTLYRPLQRGFTCDGLAHHDPARFERGETMPYRPNSALVFARTDVLFHGVHPLTEDELHGSRRRGIQLQFWVRNEWPREGCKVSFSAAPPAAMAAGGDAPVAYELTNRAALQLVSKMPNPTQLGYRWFDDAGRPVASDDPARAPFPGTLAQGATASGRMRVVAPRAPGRYLLRLSVIQEGVAWFDDVHPDNGSAHAVTVWDGARAGAGDVVADVPDVALGGGWHEPERDAGGVFRWAGDDAVVHVAALRPLRHELSLLVEPGPGVGMRPFELTAQLASGESLGTVLVSSKQLVTFALPPHSPRVFSVVLRARGGGRTYARDPRVLNFRAFDVAVARVADVFPAWAAPLRGFYPAERDGETPFRWVGGDATVALDGAHGGGLAFDAESGPGLDCAPFTLRVTGPDGRELAAAEVAARTTVRVPLGGVHGAAALTLRADGGGRVVSGDPRVLNFRVLAAR